MKINTMKTSRSDAIAFAILGAALVMASPVAAQQEAAAGHAPLTGQGYPAQLPSGDACQMALESNLTSVLHRAQLPDVLEMAALI